MGSLWDDILLWEEREAVRRAASFEASRPQRQAQAAAEQARQEAALARDVAAGIRDEEGNLLDEDDEDDG